MNLFFIKKTVRFAKKLQNKCTNNKKVRDLRVRDHYHYTGKHRGDVHNISNSKHSILKETSKVFHNGSNYDYNFIIKELQKSFDGEFNYLGKNTEKYKTFSVPVTKEVKWRKKFKNHILQVTIY